MKAFLQGKKTLIGAVMVVLAAGAGFFYGSFDAPTAVSLVGGAFTAIGLGSKIQRFAPIIIAELQELRKVQQDLAAGKKIDVPEEIVKVGEIALAAELGDRV